jgi:hypothetical protein
LPPGRKLRRSAPKRLLRRPRVSVRLRETRISCARKYGERPKYFREHGVALLSRI